MEHGVRSASLMPSDFPPQKLSRQLDFVSSVNSSRASSISTPLKPDSPRSWTLPSFEVKNSTPKKSKQCNCKNSQCLKLYCECFALNVYCNGCNCANCHNVENDPARKDAIEALLDRNPNAFRPKIDSSPQAVRHKREEAGEPLLVVKHNKGCNCKKSGCLKKYCECYQAGILCSENCKCLDCKNFEGSEDRKTLCNGDHGNPLIYIDRTANAAINGAIGSSGYVSPESKKRKTYDLLFGTVENYQPFHRHAQLSQANHLNTAQPASFTGIPVARAITPPLQSKLAYRSPLTDIIQPETVKDLCKSLVIASAQTAKTFADKKKSQDKKLGEERPSQTECSLSSSHVEDEKLWEENFKAASADDCSRETHTVKSRKEELGSDSGDAEISRRPLSPGTMALMCDEQDTMFMKSPSNFKAASADDCSRGTHTVKSHTEELGSDSADVDISRRPLSPGTMALMCDEHDTMFMKSPSNFSSSTQAESQDMTDVYAEQERCILMKFRDTLLNLVNCARMKVASS